MHLVFPLAGMVKEQTRQLAKDWNLPVASSKESFEICFVPTDDHTEFLGRHLEGKYLQQGEVVTVEGEVIGTHRGLPYYSMGQRRGFTSRKPVPYYVVGKNVEKNQLIVGNVLNSTRSIFKLVNVTWANEMIALPLRCEVRLRNMGTFDWCTVTKTSGEEPFGGYTVILDKAQRGISPGKARSSMIEE
ncbi:MAG: hypothetical protein KatS3mg087_0763 [Patescibacteria group bacterium]|nr:MAG: hypothetical protein KatS3mg087_0763 [Patescibacteria group bacterium]